MAHRNLQALQPAARPELATEFAAVEGKLHFTGVAGAVGRYTAQAVEEVLPYAAAGASAGAAGVVC